MDLALVMEPPALPDEERSLASSLAVVPDHSADGSFLRLWEWTSPDGLGLSAGVLRSPGSKVGLGVNS